MLNKKQNMHTFDMITKEDAIQQLTSKKTDVTSVLEIVRPLYSSFLEHQKEFTIRSLNTQFLVSSSAVALVFTAIFNQPAYANNHLISWALCLLGLSIICVFILYLCEEAFFSNLVNVMIEAESIMVYEISKDLPLEKITWLMSRHADLIKEYNEFRTLEKRIYHIRKICKNIYNFSLITGSVFVYQAIANDYASTTLIP